MTETELTEIEARIKAAQPQHDYAAGRTLLTVEPPTEQNHGIAALWYDDGDLCAKIEDNLGLGIDNLAMAELFAHAGADLARLVAEVRGLKEAASQMRERCAEVAERILGDEDFYFQVGQTIRALPLTEERT